MFGKKIIKITGNMRFLIFSIICAISMIGISYGFFNYYKVGENNTMKSGQILLVLNEIGNNIHLPNIYPQTAKEARKRTDNVSTFTVGGNNTTLNKDIYYEIMINEGDPESGKTRFNPSDLVFDLIEVGLDGKENLVVDAMSYDDINGRRIWVNTINRNTKDIITRTYKLRMWLSEDVIISDTEPEASYTADEFKNSYASIKVSVFGDFEVKEVPVY